MNRKISVLICAFSLLAMPSSYGNVPCEAQSVQPPMGRSQSNLLNFFDTFACKNVQSNISSDKISANYCDNVFSCKSYQSAKEVLTDEELELLDIESLDILVRETTKAEMIKYNSAKSIEVNDLLAYIGQMPSAIQEKIQKCEKIDNLDIDACLGKTTSSAMVRYYIESSLDKNTIKSSGESQRLKFSNRYQAGNQKMSFIHDLVGGSEQKNNVLSSSTLNQNRYDAEHDSVLNSIYEAVVNSGAKDPKVIKEIIRKNLLLATMNGNDSILKFDNAKTHFIIDKTLAGLKLSGGDFNSKNKDGKQLLLEKLNKIRINLANSHLSENCNSTVRSLQHVCSNITKNIKSGKTLDLLMEISGDSKNKKDPFSQMIEYYKHSDVSSKDNKIKSLEMMRDVKSGVFHKFLQYTLQAEVCKDKFGNKDWSKPEKRSQAAIDKLAEMEKSSESSRQEAIATISNTAKNNQSFREEMDRLGIKLDIDPVRNESVASNNQSQNRSQSQEAIKQSIQSVSYTHLTLPTICSV